MTTTTSRRGFLEAAGVAGGCLVLCPLLRDDEAVAGAATSTSALPDFSKLTYCCFECKPEQCPTLKATLANDPAGKAKQLEQWREKQPAKVAAWEKAKGRAMTVDDVFCHGCREEGDRLAQWRRVAPRAPASSSASSCPAPTAMSWRPARRSCG